MAKLKQPKQDMNVYMEDRIHEASNKVLNFHEKNMKRENMNFLYATLQLNCGPKESESNDVLLSVLLSYIPPHSR